MTKFASHTPSITDGEMAIHFLESREALRCVEPAWNELQHHPNSSMQQYLLSLELPGVLSPFVIVVCRDSIVQSLLVGRIEHKKVSFAFGYRTLLAPTLKRLVFLHEGLLGCCDPRTSAVLVRALRVAIQRLDVDCIYFSTLRVGTALYSDLGDCRTALRICEPLVVRRHRAMTLPSTLDGMWSRLSAKVRKNLRRQARVIEEAYGSSLWVSTFHKAQDLDTMIADVEHVARKTYQRALHVGFTDDPWTRRRMQLCAEEGWLKAYVLYVKGEPVAFWIGTLFHGTFHSNFMGYDPSLAHLSIGMYLIVKVLETMCQSHSEGARIERIDFGLGDAQYKEVLGDCEWRESSFSCYTDRWRSKWLYWAERIILFGDHKARLALERLGKFDSIKKFWRSYSQRRHTAK